MTAVNEPTVFELLGKALEVAKKRLEAEVADEPVRLRGSHLRLLSFTPVDGIRPSELAVRVGMTKQSLGEFIGTLQETGFLRVDPDPHDRRARIVAPTEKGIRQQKRTLAIFTDIEDEWRRQVGDAAWTTFRRVLGHLAAQR
jgi:DNA-binding MarR family transcriptional regulator